MKMVFLTHMHLFWIESWRKQKPSEDLLTLIKYKDSKNQEKAIYIIEAIQTEWRKIGCLLTISHQKLKEFDRENNHNDNSNCSDVVHTWLQEGSDKYPCTWDGLLQVMKDVQLNVPAQDLEEALHYYYRGK